MIRQLTPEETPLVCPLGEAFSRETGRPDLFGFSAEAFSSYWAMLMKAGVGYIWGEWDGDKLVGILGALKAANDKDGLIGVHEAFWFVDPEYRRRGGLRLVEAMEAFAQEVGASRVSMVHLAHLNADKLGALYERLGYEKCEVQYMKVLR